MKNQVNMEKISWKKINLDDNLPLNKTLKLHNLIVVVTSVFEEGNK